MNEEEMFEGYSSEEIDCDMGFLEDVIFTNTEDIPDNYKF